MTSSISPSPCLSICKSDSVKINLCVFFSYLVEAAVCERAHVLYSVLSFDCMLLLLSQQKHLPNLRSQKKYGEDVYKILLRGIMAFKKYKHVKTYLLVEMEHDRWLHWSVTGRARWVAGFGGHWPSPSQCEQWLLVFEQQILNWLSLGRSERMYVCWSSWFGKSSWGGWCSRSLPL